MKKIMMAMTMGVIVLVFSACGQKTQNNEIAGSVNGNPSENKEEKQSVTGKDDVLQNLTGEYEYLSDYGAGKLTIKKTSYGYDISDYESEASYRFLADSSNIETTEDNRIYIKYPEQIFSDGEAVFSYYVLEYGTDEIDVYYGKSSFEEAEFLYHATKEDQIVNAEESSVNQQEINVQTVKNTDSETKEDENANTNKFSVNQQENSVQPVENADSETTAEELLDLFINGSISAVDSIDLTSAFYITDLNMDSGEGDSYSIGEKVDLDNDGVNELVINGPYGGIYLDARNNKIYEFAAGDGNALILSYVYYNGAIWIMYSNRMNAGYESYHMEKFEGADNLVAEMNFGEELVDPNDSEPETKYTLNGAIISYDEYTELCSKIFATEVNTN